MPGSTPEPAPGPGRRVRLGEEWFDRESGELTDAQGATRRLPPQPAALLGLLVDRAGHLVTREQIRAALWPDVAVDFDTSLHHCVRQVRAALGDPSKAPRFIETIPRRGYRLRAEALRAQPQPPETPSLRRDRPVRTAVGLLLALALGMTAWLVLQPTTASSDGLRIAIMSFAGGGDASRDAERIGERVLVELTRRRPEAAILGPRSTQPLRQEGRPVRAIASTLDAAYVLNAKHLEARPALLVELIRTRDGKHVWVHDYTDLRDWQRIAAEISDGVASTVP